MLLSNQENNLMVSTFNCPKEMSVIEDCLHPKYLNANSNSEAILASSSLPENTRVIGSLSKVSEQRFGDASPEARAARGIFVLFTAALKTCQ